MVSVAGRIVLCAAFLASSGLAEAGGITIDGRTPTKITADPGGATRVIIAPADARGHSRNTYKDFNVEKPGVVLDNSTAGAGLILNEVTSKAFSRIEGQLSVHGARADVVIANPNGLLVNGARFVNTGRVGLIAGARRGRDGNGFPQYQLGEGRLRVGASGVLAETGSLHLAAPLLQIDGPVVAPEDVQLIAGRGALIVGKQDITGWIGFAGSGQGGRILLSSGARLSGGAITMQADGSGAGVRMAGTALARAGDFILTSDGRIEISGAITARDTVAVIGNEIDIGGRDTRTRLTSTQASVQLRSAGDVSVGKTTLTGAGQGFFGFDTQASVAILSGGNAYIKSSDLTAQTGFVEVISDETLRFSNTQIRAKVDILTSGKAGIAGDSSYLKAGEALRFTSASGDINLTQTDAVAGLALVARGGNLTFSSTTFKRNRVQSTKAGVVLAARGDLSNDGVLVQGRRKIEGEQGSTEAVTVTAGGNLTLTSLSETSIGAFYSEDNALSVDVARNILNLSGRFLSDTSMIIRAGAKLTNTVAETDEDVDGLTLPGEGYVSFGNFLAGREVGEITAKQTVRLYAGSIANHGGEITGDTVYLRARDVSIQPERFGWQEYRKDCVLFFFCRRSARGQMLYDGGGISATDLLDIKASQQVTLTGASLSATNMMRLTAPDISLSAYRFYEFFERRTGLAGLFRGKTAVRVANYASGTLFSSAGDIVITSTRPVYDEQTEISAFGQISIPKGRTALGFSDSITRLNKRRSGIFRFMTKGTRK